MSHPVLSDEESQLLKKIVESTEKTMNVQFGIRGIVYIHHEEGIYTNGLDYYEALLEGLEEKGLIKKIESSYNIFCPNCNYPNVYSRYSCPTCKTTHLKQVRIIQHARCGYIGPKVMMGKTNKVQCPKCKTIITESSEQASTIYERVGFHFECENHHKFSRPDITHLCPSCDARFDYKESNYRPLYDYALTEKTYQMIRQDIDINEVLSKVTLLLTQLGYSATRDDEIVGFSSSVHFLPLTGVKDEKLFLFGVSESGNKDELIKLLGKKMDIEHSVAVFLDSYGNKELESLGQVYNIKIMNLTDSAWYEKMRKWLLENDPEKKNLVMRSAK